MSKRCCTFNINNNKNETRKNREKKKAKAKAKQNKAKQRRKRETTHSVTGRTANALLTYLESACRETRALKAIQLKALCLN